MSMQGPPMDLRMPKTDPRDSASGTPATVALFAVALAAFLAVWIALMVVHEDHSGDQAGTPEQAQCISDQLNNAGNGGDFDADACTPVMPWYAAHPFWYALIVGTAVFVVGRIGMFMVRMERARGY